MGYGTVSCCFQLASCMAKWNNDQRIIIDLSYGYKTQESVKFKLLINSWETGDRALSFTEKLSRAILKYKRS